jgi:hypothetical protein
LLRKLYPKADFQVSDAINEPKTKGIDVCNSYMAEGNFLILDCEGFDNEKNVEIHEYDKDVEDIE